MERWQNVKAAAADFVFDGTVGECHKELRCVGQELRQKWHSKAMFNELCVARWWEKWEIGGCVFGDVFVVVGGCNGSAVGEGGGESGVDARENRGVCIDRAGVVGNLVPSGEIGVLSICAPSLELRPPNMFEPVGENAGGRHP